MTKKEKAIEIVKECDASGFATVAAGVFLESRASMVKQQAGWYPDDPGSLMDFTAHPYWMTTDNGTMPVGISGAEDTDLLDAIE